MGIFRSTLLADRELSALEQCCEACGGLGEIPARHERHVLHCKHRCEACQGTGSVVTEDGKRLLDFFARHGR